MSPPEGVERFLGREEVHLVVGAPELERFSLVLEAPYLRFEPLPLSRPEAAKQLVFEFLHRTLGLSQFEGGLDLGAEIRVCLAQLPVPHQVEGRRFEEFSELFVAAIEHERLAMTDHGPFL
jgi:hypothetical protein